MSTHTTCQTCGTAISKLYARVFGNNDNEVYACPACSSGAEVAKGAAADPASTEPAENVIEEEPVLLEEIETDATSSTVESAETAFAELLG